MKTLIFAALVIFVYWVLSKVNKLFYPPTIEEQIEHMKEQEGTVRIHKARDGQAKPAKPKIQELGQDVEFEEVKE